jgi:hypothetical protein
MDNSRYTTGFLAGAFNWDESEPMPQETNGVLRRVFDYFYADDAADRVAQLDEYTQKKVRAGIIDNDMVNITLPTPKPRQAGAAGTTLGKLVDLVTSTPAKAAISDVLMGDLMKEQMPITEDAMQPDELDFFLNMYRRLGAGSFDKPAYGDIASFGIRSGNQMADSAMLNMSAAERSYATIGAGSFELQPNGDVHLVDSYDQNYYRTPDDVALTAEQYEQQYKGMSGNAKAIYETLTSGIGNFTKIHNLSFVLGSRDYEDDSRDVGRKVRINLGNPNAYNGTLPESLNNFMGRYVVNRNVDGQGGYTLTNKYDSPSFLAEFGDSVGDVMEEIGFDATTIASVLTGNRAFSSVVNEPIEPVMIATTETLDNYIPRPRPDWFERNDIEPSFPSGPMDDERKGFFDIAMEALFPSAQADELDLDYIKGLEKTKIISPDQAMGVAQTGNVLTGGLNKFEAEIMHGTEVPSILDFVSPFGSSKN